MYNITTNSPLNTPTIPIYKTSNVSLNREKSKARLEYISRIKVDPDIDKNDENILKNLFKKKI